MVSTANEHMVIFGSSIVKEQLGVAFRDKQHSTGSERLYIY
jgi:hypothetical protein